MDRKVSPTIRLREGFSSEENEDFFYLFCGRELVAPFSTTDLTQEGVDKATEEYLRKKFSRSQGREARGN